MVSFVYDDCHVIQLQFAFRRSLRNGVPLHGKGSFVWQSFLRREPLNFAAWCRQRRFDFSGSSPYKNYDHDCGCFSFVRFLSVAWPYNYYQTCQVSRIWRDLQAFSCPTRIPARLLSDRPVVPHLPFWWSFSYFIFYFFQLILIT